MRAKGILAASLLAASLAACAAGGGGRKMGTFYVDPAGGDDSRDGTSIATAWKTLARASKAAPGPGGRILLRGGRSHAGPLVLSAASGGSEGSPVTVSSYGDTAAIIDGGAGDAVTAIGVRDLAISRLVLKGLGRKDGNRGGRGIYLQDCVRVDVDSVEASGFQKAGIQSWKCDRVSVSRFHAHENGFAGILMAGSNIRVTDSRAINNPGDPTIMDNHSGNGILLGQVTDGLVEYCEAAGNGWDQPRGGQPNGPVGIWTHDSSRVVIRHCIAHHNKSTSGDGGGFDFDGGASDCVLEYCLSYDNVSSGILLWEYGSKLRLERNVIRNNAFVNDGEAGVRFGRSGGHGVKDILVRNNLVLSDGVPCVWGQTEGVEGVGIRDNVLVHRGKGEKTRDKGGVEYLDNCDADPALYDSLLEKARALTDPRKLDGLRAFVLPDSAACAGKGIVAPE